MHDIQKIVDAITGASHKATTKNILKLGELIKLLEIRPQDESIRFDFCNFTPDAVNSYRGYYSDLAIGYSESGKTKVSDLLNRLKSVLNTSLTGYKGGDFVMHENVPVWVANYGKCHGTAITGIKSSDYGTIIETACID